VKTLFRQATVIAGNGNWSATRGVDVLLADGCVSEIGVGLAAPLDAQVVPASSLVLIPAFANAHTHSPEMLGRGVLPMAEQTEWLSQAYADGRDWLSDADITRAVRLCAADTVRGGAVSVTDHFRQTPPRIDAVAVAAKAWAGTGVRARLAVLLRDRVATNGGLVGVPNSSGLVASTGEILALAKELLDRKFSVPVGLGPSAPQRVTDELLLGFVALMRERGSFMHMHLCESAADADDCRALYGISAVAHLDQLGVLGPDVELAHAVHVDDDDLTLLAARGARVVHNPVANLRLGNGVAPIARALARGVCVALGADGAGSNDSQSLLEAAKFAMLAPRASRPSGEWLSPEQVLDMATSGACLEPGAQADLIALDGNASAFVGAKNDFAARIVLAARETDLLHVVGGGAFLMRDRALCLP
jgi:cytosine/adenosine deaminase-related metal-dependent hydrolase